MVLQCLGDVRLDKRGHDLIQEVVLDIEMCQDHVDVAPFLLMWERHVIQSRPGYWLVRKIMVQRCLPACVAALHE